MMIVSLFLKDLEGYTMVKIHMLPVGVGDFFWIRFGKDESLEHNILIDGGHEKFSGIYEHIFRLIASENQKALIILTHIDADHIQGAAQGIANLSCDLLNPVIDRILLNTGRGISKEIHDKREHSPERQPLMPEDQILVFERNLNHSFHDAETFLEMIEKKGLSSKLVDYTIAGTEMVYGEAKLRFVSPGKEELERLTEKWETYNQCRGIHFTSANTPEKDDLQFLMNKKFGADPSVTNRSSLAFLFEYQDIKGAFLGDAAAPVVYKGLRKLGLATPYPLDFLKLPHHGGRYNMSDKLLKAFPTRNYLLSTEGIPKSDVPSKVLFAHILKNQMRYDLFASQCSKEDLAREEKDSGNRGQTVTVYSNYAWWDEAYAGRYFSNRDMKDYIQSGLIDFARLTAKPLHIRDGLFFSRLI